MAELRLSLSGMHCQACATRIEKVLLRQEGITQASVSFASEEAFLRYDAERVDVEQLIEAVSRIGFEAKPLTAQDFPELVQESKRPWSLYLGLALSLPFALGMLGMLWGSHAWMPPVYWQFALASLAQTLLAWPFYRGAFGALKGGSANMDVLVTLGTVATYAYSTAMLFAGQHEQIYFEAAVMVLTFVSVGKYLESKSKRESLNSLVLLMQYQPQLVQVWRDERWEELALSTLQKGDLLLARTGDRIAADGQVVRGQALCNEGHLTGESDLLEKGIGSRVLAGALLEDGSLEYRAESLGMSTELGDMMKALAEAQSSKAPISRMADRVAAIFVPLVLLLSLLCFLLNYWLTALASLALMRAVAILVVACPCALGLATPASLMVGLGRATRAGIRFKDAASLEASAQIDEIYFDKTGTLTKGKAAVVDLALCSTLSREEVLRYAASLEQHAKHPLARAFLEAASGLSLWPVEDLKQQTGAGLEGRVEGKLCRLGKLSYLGASLPEGLGGPWQVATLVALSVEGELVAFFALMDQLKTGAKETIEALKARGFELGILSGDRPEAVAYIAEQLGISRIEAGLSSRQKGRYIEARRSQGRKILMVGDGVNDAPALALANASFAMQDGAELSQHAASASLGSGSLASVGTALEVASSTLRNIRQNLFFAFIYNIIMIPLAAFGYLSPILAAAAMALSSLSVIANALRLRAH